MSGGYFDYKQYAIHKITNKLESVILKEKRDPRLFCKETLKELKKGLKILNKAAVYAQRIDWLLSCDDGEESFHERLADDLKNI